MKILIEEPCGFSIHEEGHNPLIVESVLYEYNQEFKNFGPKINCEVLGNIKIYTSGEKITCNVLAESVSCFVFLYEKGVCVFDKADVFKKAVDFISQKVSETAVNNGYFDVLKSKDVEKFIKIVQTALSNANGKSIYIPYIADADFSHAREGQDYSQMPHSYCLTDDDIPLIEDSVRQFFSSFPIKHISVLNQFVNNIISKL